MALNASKVETKFKKPDVLEAGGYPGRLVQLIDLGLQPQSYEGKATEPAPEIYITLELSDEFLKDEEGNDLTDKPRWFSESFSLRHIKSEKAKSTKRYMAFDPALKYDGDWVKLLGMPVMVNLIQNPSKKDKSVVYNNIGSLSAMRAKDAEKLPPLVNPIKVFDLDNPDMEVFKALPEFIQKKITSNLEFNGSKLQAALGGKQVDSNGADASASYEDAGTPPELDDENPY